MLYCASSENLLSRNLSMINNRKVQLLFDGHFSFKVGILQIRLLCLPISEQKMRACVCVCACMRVRACVLN